MEHRQLGATGLHVAVVGLGGGHLPRDAASVARLMGEALDEGVNYCNVALQTRERLRGVARAMRGRRGEIVLATHLDAVRRGRQVAMSRDPAECERAFGQLLSILDTDYTDVLFVSHVDSMDEYEHVVSGPGGTLALAHELKQRGMARSVGMSGHTGGPVLAAVEAGQVDVVMLPINPAFDALPLGSGLGECAALLLNELDAARRIGDDTKQHRQSLYDLCAEAGVGVVGMKAFGGGWLLRPPKNGLPALSPVQCLSYALARPAVATVVAGVANLGELAATLALVDASPEERSFRDVVAQSTWRLDGVCTRCGHCLPCPEGIDIPGLMHLSAVARHHGQQLRGADGASVSIAAEACARCGVCADRCPFGVDVPEQLRTHLDQVAGGD